MKKSIVIFVTTTICAIGILIFGWIFASGEVSEAVLTEETLYGNKEAAAGLTVGFTEETKGDLRWKNSFDYSTDQSESARETVLPDAKDEKNAGMLKFRHREDKEEKQDVKTDEEGEPVDVVQFTGESFVPFVTKVEYGRILTEFQRKGIQNFYDEIQHRVMETGETETGKIRVQDYMDYYPLSFRFQFGETIYNMDNALTGLKVLEERGVLDEATGADYLREVELYNILRENFKIPIIDNEYQEYTVSKVKTYNPDTALGYKTAVKNPLGEGEDYYRFNPILTYQDEPLQGEEKWVHPDLDGKEENHKNRVLFIVNNRTEKGNPVDVSQIKGGYGVYSLPVDVSQYAKKDIGNRTAWALDSQPLPTQMEMVYPLDAEAEYIEISLSKDHRYLAVFSEKDGDCYVDIVDADYWTSDGAIKLFTASEKMTYTWGEDGSLAVTDGKKYVAVFEKTAAKVNPYDLIYSGKTEADFSNTFFRNGLAVAAKDGKAALVQNLTAGDGELGVRNPALACAVMDKTGILYRGTLKSNLVDLDYDMEAEDIAHMRGILSEKAEDETDAEVMQKHLLRANEEENWVKWGN